MYKNFFFFLNIYMHVFAFTYSPIGSWICPHTEKFKQTKKGLPKITFFIFHMQKWKKCKVY